MLSQVRKLYSFFSRKSHKGSSSFNKALNRECVVIQNVEASTKENTPVDESELFRISPPAECSTLPWSNILMCALIVGVTLLLLSPTIVFYVPRDLLGLDVDTSTFEAGTNETVCTSQEYSGTVCLTELQQWYYCGDNSGPVPISSGVDQEAQEIAAQQILTGLQFLNPSTECVRVFRPFFCLFSFSLCDGSGQVVQPSYQDCVDLRTETCAEEIKKAIALLGSDPFPLCERFPHNVTLCDGDTPSGSGKVALNSGIFSGLNESGITEFESSGEETVTECSDDFFFDNSSQVCKPECATWTPFTPRKEKVLVGLRLFASSLGVISSLLVLALSCAQYKRMFKFPTIFIVYQTLAVLVYSLLNMMGWVWRKELLCKSRDLTVSLEAKNTTLKCKLIGGIFVYLLIQTELWLLFHTIITMCGVVWPIKYKYYKKYYTKHIHVGAIILGAVLPVIPALVALLMNAYRVTVVAHYDCTLVNVNTAFYGVVLPAECLLITTVIMLLFILRRITSWKCLKSIGSNRSGANTAEIKIMIIIVYYTLLSLYSITISIVTFLETDSFTEEAKNYFLCEANGVEAATKCSKMQFDKFDGVSKVFGHILIGSYPVIFLVYIVQVKTCIAKAKSALTIKYFVSST